MEGHCSTGQSPQWAVVPMEEEEEEEEEEEGHNFRYFFTIVHIYNATHFVWLCYHVSLPKLFSTCLRRFC